MKNWDGHSGRHDKRARSSAPGLSDLFQILLDAATGRPHRSGRSRRSRHHGEKKSHAHAASPVSPPVVIWKVSASKFALIAVIAVGLIWTDWRILADTVGINLANSAPETAVAWSPKSQAALDKLAQRELAKADGDLDAAQEWAQRALHTHPLDQQALFLLGVVAEKKGDREKSLELVRAASERSWRNLGVQLWLFQRNAARKDYDQALVHADALFRVEPRFLPTIFPAVASFSTTPDGLKALAAFLATDPPWRLWVVQSLALRLFDKNNLDAIFAQLSQSSSPPTPRELRTYLSRLIKDGRFDFAYRTWRGALPASMKDGGVPYNGDFRFPADGQPFNWALDSSLGFDVQIVPSDDSKGNALRAQFSGARVNFNKVGQIMLLQPGSYRLSGRVKADELRSDRGLWWKISCISDNKAELGHTELVSGTKAWTDFHADFSVPSQDCNAQEIRLELPARIASEHEIEGEIWYENLRIAPIPGTVSPSVVNNPPNN